LLDDELARAVRLESSKAIQYWWGVTDGVVWRWRKALGVTRFGTEGSQVLFKQVSAAGAAAVRGKPQPRALVRRRMKTRRAGNYPPPNRWVETGWKGEELALLGTMPDVELAIKIGRTRYAVRAARVRLRRQPPASNSNELITRR
jgi:hypothetical protein